MLFKIGRYPFFPPLVKRDWLAARSAEVLAVLTLPLPGVVIIGPRAAKAPVSGALAALCLSWGEYVMALADKPATGRTGEPGPPVTA